MVHSMPDSQVPHLSWKDFTPQGAGRVATRRYLRTQLKELDEQIEAILETQSRESWRALERAAAAQPAAAKIVWTSRLELYYLDAVREALLETLAYL